MNKTGIEWCDYTLNPVKGLCPMACSYCYARKDYIRWGWNPDITWKESVLFDIAKVRTPSRIFIGSTFELFGEWVKPEWLSTIFDYCRQSPRHTFIFLSKRPDNLARWQFPSNCWVGCSITEAWGDTLMKAWRAFNALSQVNASVKFISFEPLRGPVDEVSHTWLIHGGIKWVIIGQQTPVKRLTMPNPDWVEWLIKTADRAGASVFMKNNIDGLLPFKRQEVPA